MPPRVIALAVLLGTATAAADEHPVTGWREALAVEFESTQPASSPPREASPLRPGVPLPDFDDDDPEAVLLPSMTVSANRTYRDLDRGIAERYSRLKANELSWKGGPLYQRKIGPLHFGVYSVLYIPVAVAFTW